METRMTAEQIKVLDKEYAERIDLSGKDMDWETSHEDNDRLLCKILSDIGFTKTVKAFKRTKRWYA